MRRLLVSLIAVLATLLSAGLPGASAAGLPLTLVKAGFDRPVLVTNAGDSRLFVVELGGKIKIIHSDGTVSTFLNISSGVMQGSEQVLLALAFSPSYATNGLFYIWYTPAAGGAEVLAEFHRSTSNPDLADPNGRLILSIKDPYENHNGGSLFFKDGDLYLTTGDGGSGGDPEKRAQDTQSLWGKILRIVPSDPDGAGPKRYSVPSDNPFVGRTGLDEIWSIGLRNPWRCSVDPSTGYIWCGDVGQAVFEEIDRVPTGRGTNFGWRKLEGMHYYQWPGHTRGDVCVGTCYTLPIAEYTHNGFGGGNCAVTGGYVSRRAGAVLAGKYVFGDFCSGKVWIIPASLPAGHALPAAVADTPYSISSFGEGADRRLYLVDLGGGIYRLNES